MFEKIAEYYNQVPPEGWSAVIGVLASSSVTQLVKRYIPIQWCGLSPSTARFVVRMLAFWLGFAATYATWPASVGPDPWRLWVAITVGLMAPTLYKLTVFLLYKKFPQLEKMMSRDP